ncbi:hypothetical protein QBC39DRAFT_104622 [Podospora conica]|nr:hypothetical protein QBC39DRAFT_104622 [Schizothecium conicum]
MRMPSNDDWASARAAIRDHGSVLSWGRGHGPPAPRGGGRDAGIQAPQPSRLGTVGRVKAWGAFTWDGGLGWLLWRVADGGPSLFFFFFFIPSSILVLFCVCVCVSDRETVLPTDPTITISPFSGPLLLCLWSHPWGCLHDDLRCFLAFYFFSPATLFFCVHHLAKARAVTMNELWQRATNLPTTTPGGFFGTRDTGWPLGRRGMGRWLEVG